MVKLCTLLQLKLVDAGFIWTEPHSKRLKLKLAVQVCCCLSPRQCVSLRHAQNIHIRRRNRS